jgi:hypothetical protein
LSNARDIEPNQLRILLIGDGGTHKTYFCSTIPGVYIFDFDDGMATARGRDVEYDLFSEAPKGMKTRFKQYAWGHAWPAIHKKMDELGDALEKGQGPKALAFDSLTTLSQLIVNHALLVEGKGLDLPHQGTWGVHHNVLKTVFGQLMSWPVHFIMTAHIHRDENDLTKVVEKLPLVAGKAAGFVGVYFDEVYYTERTVNTQKEVKYTVTSGSTPMLKQAKSRWGVPDGTELSWNALAAFFEKAGFTLPKGR